MKYIDAEKLIAEIEKWRDKAKEKYNESVYNMGRCDALAEFRNYIVALQQDKPELDLDYLKNKAELIANGIMIGVQANKYHTCIYDKASNDFNHSHLVRAALKGIEFGLNAEKEE